MIAYEAELIAAVVDTRLAPRVAPSMSLKAAAMPSPVRQGAALTPRYAPIPRLRSAALPRRTHHCGSRFPSNNCLFCSGHRLVVTAHRFLSGSMTGTRLNRFRDRTTPKKPSIMSRLEQATSPHGNQEGSDPDNITRETVTLAGERNEQNTGTSDQLPYASDAGSNADPLPSFASDTGPGDSLEPSPSEESSGSNRKNDQAWVEQKNGAIVRRLVDYGRFVGAEATAGACSSL